MQHAHSPARRKTRPVLPVLLVTAAVGAFGGLALLPVAAEGQDDRLLTAAATPQVAPPLVLPDRDIDRASRTRALAALAFAKPSPKPVPTAAPKPSPKPAPTAAPQPKAAPKPRPRPVVKATPTSKPRARPRPTPAKVVAAAPTSSGGRCPVPSASFTDTYGAPRSGGRTHKGTDLLAPFGAPVYAVANGVVDTTSSSNGGISLYLRATNGERYFYAHNSANVARDGQRVQAGDLIARVGSTGNAGSINHVHFEREVGGQSVNPYRFLRGIC